MLPQSRARIPSFPYAELRISPASPALTVCLNESPDENAAVERDSREYRMYALQCAEMAAQARTPQLKASLLELSANWTRLAQSFEAAQAWLAKDDSDPLIGVPQQRLAGVFLN
jgi:hypothetical protein